MQLTPTYDFAPMYLDRDLIVRSCRWSTDDRSDITDISDIIERLKITETAKRDVAAGMRDFAAAVFELPEIMRSCGVDDEVIEHCKPYIEAQSDRLDRV